MSSILYILIAIVILGFIVMVHEFGHYIMGRIFRIGIIEFSVGFGPKIISFRGKSGILHSLRAIPLGGYCSFVGEDGKDYVPDDDPNRKPPDDAFDKALKTGNALNEQPVWKRFLTIAAGPLMNFVLAFIFCTILISNYYVAEDFPRVIEVVADSPSEACGLQSGDVIVQVDGVDVSFDSNGVNAVRAAIQATKAETPLHLTIDRGGERIELDVQPERIENPDGSTLIQMGFYFDYRTFTFGEALGRSFHFMKEDSTALVSALKDMVFGKEEVDVMGPVGIIDFMSNEVSTNKFFGVVNLVYFLSLNLGIMNLLPLPGLDGGRLIFLIVEAIRRKPIPPEKEGLVHALGMGLLFVFIIIITYKDIIRLISGG